VLEARPDVSPRLCEGRRVRTPNLTGLGSQLATGIKHQGIKALHSATNERTWRQVSYSRHGVTIADPDRAVAVVPRSRARPLELAPVQPARTAAHARRPDSAAMTWSKHSWRTSHLAQIARAGSTSSPTFGKNKVEAHPPTCRVSLPYRPGPGDLLKAYGRILVTEELETEGSATPRRSARQRQARARGSRAEDTARLLRFRGLTKALVAGRFQAPEIVGEG
jgi:hypothetical protein